MTVPRGSPLCALCGESGPEAHHMFIEVLAGAAVGQGARQVAGAGEDGASATSGVLPARWVWCALAQFTCPAVSSSLRCKASMAARSRSPPRRAIGGNALPSPSRQRTSPRLETAGATRIDAGLHDSGAIHRPPAPPVVANAIRPSPCDPFCANTPALSPVLTAHRRACVVAGPPERTLPHRRYDQPRRPSSQIPRRP
jgi:hypothetical protein